MGKLGSFIAGGLIGAGLALLFAPRSGEETRAMVADKAEECWGKGYDLYDQGKTRLADAQPAIAKKSDELREKIDGARNLIAEQVAKNAANARDAINDKMPGASEKLSKAAEAVRGRIDSATSKVKEMATKTSSKELDAVSVPIKATASDVDKEPDAIEEIPGAQKTSKGQAK